jgi:hypothetical protein
MDANERKYLLAPQASQKYFTAEAQRPQRDNKNLCALCASAVKKYLMPAAQIKKNICVHLRPFAVSNSFVEKSHA